ncbi:binding-protein-dependent transport systems inner membrane component [Pyrobaculum islandicum DSM 4184]|uniref:Binding-protein-dependent transport systems inner membrane component n=1 Tax=Pyrobaculum islandicum (strain DSM 4184 / JCM 9189 / GEO3) TaxID=384616 RepID=A1RR84_PYRIL|nr:ABC transporter permease [Pyrobaculum islandicum]ABL87466.1 binding-protein-dependent transport systems inner membrane component [Pyrobaculum islandicum DSM 4184]
MKILRIYTWALIAMLYIPVALIVALSFNDSKLPYIWGGFTYKWYLALFQWEQAWQALFNSFVIALAVSLVATLLGVFMAYVLRSDKYLAISQGAVVMPEISEALAFAAALWLVKTYVGVDLFGPVGVFLAHLAYTLPMAHVLLTPYIAYVGKSVVEASRILGASEMKTVAFVILPILMPAFIATFLIVFVNSFDTYIKTAFTTSPGFITAPILLWNYAARGRGDPTIYALATLMLVPSIAAAVIYFRAIKRYSLSP